MKRVSSIVTAAVLSAGMQVESVAASGPVGLIKKGLTRPASCAAMSKVGGS